MPFLVVILFFGNELDVSGADDLESCLYNLYLAAGRRSMGGRVGGRNIRTNFRIILDILVGGFYAVFSLEIALPALYFRPHSREFFGHEA